VADYFFDSSALVKAYIAEAGTNWVRTILDDPQHRISISALAEVEVISALTRRYNEGDLIQIELDQACDELSQDCATYFLVNVTNQILEAAVSNARNHSLRAYDGSNSHQRSRYGPLCWHCKAMQLTSLWLVLISL